MQEDAEIVIIGAGIVGTSAAFFLAEKGWKNIVVLEQGHLFETGGSTSHAPGLVFELNASKTLCQLAQWSVETYRGLQWRDLPCFYPVGSIEVAYSPERWQDLKVKWGRALSWGLQADLISREEVLRKIPFLNPSQIHGALSVPTDGVAKGIRAVEALALRAKKRGVRFHGNTEVIGIKKDGHRIQGVMTSQGTIRTQRVLVCAGIWGPRIGRMAGVPIPLTPVEHQYVRTASLRDLKGETREITYPILRDQDHSLYFRQHFDSFGIGSYRHEPLLVEPDHIGKDHSTQSLLPSLMPSLMPSLRPFTPQHFIEAHARACQLFPSFEGVELVEKINGMFSFTPDGNPLVGESMDVRGFWVAEGVWVTHGPGVGRIVAELISGDNPALDLRELDLNRFANHASSPAYIRIRGAQQYREVYDIIHPLQQIKNPRPLRVSPFYSRQKELGAVFFESSGWERPQWFEANASLPEEEGSPNRSGWNALHWSSTIGREHRATRESVALFDITAFAKFEVSGPGALEFLQRISANQIDQPIGRIVYTAMLNQQGGIMCDLTVTRRGIDRFWIVTGGSVGMHDRAWILEHLKSEGSSSVQFTDLTSSYCCLGVWGPRSRALLQSVSENNLSNEAFPYYTAQPIYIGCVPSFAMRLSYVGELGWEIYAPTEYGLHLWDTLWESGRLLGIIAAGGAAFDSLRLEKGYRLWGADIHSEYNSYEAGIEFAIKLNKSDFIGKSAVEKIKSLGVRRKLCCLTLEENNVILMGKEPILQGDEVLGYVTSANYGYSVRKSIVYGYLPIEHSQVGTSVEVIYLGRRHTAYVSQEPLFDPTHSRLKG